MMGYIACFLLGLLWGVLVAGILAVYNTNKEIKTHVDHIRCLRVYITRLQDAGAVVRLAPYPGSEPPGWVPKSEGARWPK